MAFQVLFVIFAKIHNLRNSCHINKECDVQVWKKCYFTIKVANTSILLKVVAKFELGEIISTRTRDDIHVGIHCFRNGTFQIY